MNKPVAWAYIKNNEFWDAIHPDEHEREEGSYDTPLYTHPVKELNDGGEPVKNATYWKRQHDNLLMKLNTCAIKVSELEKKAHPVKELTDFEIMQISATYPDRLYFARAILRKAGA